MTSVASKRSAARTMPSDECPKCQFSLFDATGACKVCDFILTKQKLRPCIECKKPNCHVFCDMCGQGLHKRCADKSGVELEVDEDNHTSMICKTCEGDEADWNVGCGGCAEAFANEELGLQVGQLVLVEYEFVLYNAVVMEVNNTDVKIHFVRWSKSFDGWYPMDDERVNESLACDGCNQWFHIACLPPIKASGRYKHTSYVCESCFKDARHNRKLKATDTAASTARKKDPPPKLPVKSKKGQSAKRQDDDDDQDVDMQDDGDDDGDEDDEEIDDDEQILDELLADDPDLLLPELPKRKVGRPSLKQLKHERETLAERKRVLKQLKEKKRQRELAKAPPTTTTASGRASRRPLPPGEKPAAVVDKPPADKQPKAKPAEKPRSKPTSPAADDRPTDDARPASRAKQAKPTTPPAVIDAPKASKKASPPAAKSSSPKDKEAEAPVAAAASPPKASSTKATADKPSSTTETSERSKKSDKPKAKAAEAKPKAKGASEAKASSSKSSDAKRPLELEKVIARKRSRSDDRGANGHDVFRPIAPKPQPIAEMTSDSDSEQSDAPVGRRSSIVTPPKPRRPEPEDEDMVDVVKPVKGKSSLSLLSTLLNSPLLADKPSPPPPLVPVKKLPSIATTVATMQDENSRHGTNHHPLPPAAPSSSFPTNGAAHQTAFDILRVVASQTMHTTSPCKAPPAATPEVSIEYDMHFCLREEMYVQVCAMEEAGLFSRDVAGLLRSWTHPTSPRFEDVRFVYLVNKHNSPATLATRLAEVTRNYG